MPMSRKIWLAVSAEEWHASASMALEPETTAATNLKAAMATFTARAAMTTREPPPSCLAWSATALILRSRRVQGNDQPAPQLVDSFTAGRRHRHRAAPERL